MSDQNSMTGRISITVLPQENGSYLCQIMPTFNELSKTAQIFYGQTPEHTIKKIKVKGQTNNQLKAEITIIPESTDQE